jgi:peptidoglycan/LPS O-acetylase OafA/YrhL
VANSRENHFNLLRLLLAAGVLLSHCFILVGGGYRALEPWIWFTQGEQMLGTLCVQGFFIISGYLVSESFERAPHLRPYTTARILRIYPAAIACALIVGVLLGPLVSSQSQADYFVSADLREFLVSATTYLDLNAKDYVHGVFATNPVPNRLNGPLWTISWELLCYLLLIPVGIVLYRQRRRALRTAMFVGLLVCAFIGAWEVALRPLPTDHASGLLVFWGYFSIGILGRELLPKLPRHWGLTTAAVVLFLVISRLQASMPALAIASPFLFGYALLNLATQLPLRLLAFNRLGDFSYGTYLWAWPVQQTVVFLLPGLGPAGLFLLAMPATLGLAAASWYWLERPALQWKARLRSDASRPKPATPLATPSIATR